MMLDATKSEEQRRLLEIELDAVGIRLNKKKPDVVFKRKTTGGVSISEHQLLKISSTIFADYCTSRHSPSTPSLQIAQLTATVKLTKTDEKTIRTILASCTLSLFALDASYVNPTFRQVTQLRCDDSRRCP